MVGFSSRLLQSPGSMSTVDWRTLDVVLCVILDALAHPAPLPTRDSSQSRSVITRLLQRDPNRRLGDSGAEVIKHTRFAIGLRYRRRSSRRSGQVLTRLTILRSLRVRFCEVPSLRIRI